MSETKYIELPLDPEFLTPDGFYMAGYIWGQHVRSEKDARYDFPGDTQGHTDFYQGVSDGYNDKMNAMHDEMVAKTAPKKPQEPLSDAQLAKLIADAGNLYQTGRITLEEYMVLTVAAIGKIDDYTDVPF